MTIPTREQCIAWAQEAELLGDRIPDDYADAAGIERGKHWLCGVTEDKIIRALSLAYAAGAAAELEKIMLEVWQPVKGKSNGQS